MIITAAQNLLSYPLTFPKTQILIPNSFSPHQPYPSSFSLSPLPEKMLHFLDKIFSTLTFYRKVMLNLRDLCLAFSGSGLLSLRTPLILTRLSVSDPPTRWPLMPCCGKVQWKETWTRSQKIYILTLLFPPTSFGTKNNSFIQLELQPPIKGGF